MLDIISKYSGICIVFKIISHIIIEAIRKDKVETNYIRGAGIGGVFLFPIPKGKNKYLNYWSFIANILFYGSLIIVVMDANS